MPYWKVTARKELSSVFFSDKPTQKTIIDKLFMLPIDTTGILDELEEMHGEIRAIRYQIANINGEIGDIHLAPNAYPFLYFLNSSKEKKETLNLLNTMFQHEISGKKIFESFTLASILQSIVEGHWDIASDKFQKLLSMNWFDYSGRYFCDVPFPRLMLASLFGIYGKPYYFNPNQTIRVSYKAKETQMFSDCLIFDQCRYYFDRIPTIDLMIQLMERKEYQLIARIFLDRICWHDFNSSSRPIQGAALAGRGESKSAKPFYQKDRQFLN